MKKIVITGIAVLAAMSMSLTAFAAKNNAASKTPAVVPTEAEIVAAQAVVENYRLKVIEANNVNEVLQAELKKADEAKKLAEFEKAHYEAVVLASPDEATLAAAKAQAAAAELKLTQATAVYNQALEAATKAETNLKSVMDLAGQAKDNVAAMQKTLTDAKAQLAEEAAKAQAQAAEEAAKAQAQAAEEAAKAQAQAAEEAAKAQAQAAEAAAKAAEEAARIAALGNPADKDEQTKQQARKFVAEATTLWKDTNPAQFETYDNKYVVMNGMRFNLQDIGEGFTTAYKTSGANRCSNIAVAASRINGRVVFPGQTFSYDKSLLPRTSANGYKLAGVFDNGQHAVGMGGGVCQVSSTLYNAVLNDNLTVVERHPHSLPVTYVPKGRDATVAEGTLDFRFRNDYPLPVCVLSWTEGKTISVKIVAVQVP